MTPKSKDRQGLGDAIRAKVAELGTSLEKASIELGVQSNALSRWNTFIEPGAENYAVLMEFLGVSLDELGGLILTDQLRKWGLPEP